MNKTNNELYEYLETAVPIAKEAGALLREGFGQQNTITRKSSEVDWVTEYDTAAEALIDERLLAAYPDHGLLGEEGSSRAGNGRFRWIVDPLDGTNNFAHGYPVFCVSLALYEGETPLVGVIYDPTRDECFTAAAGGGAQLTTPKGTRTLHVSQAAQLNASVLATGFPYDRQTSPVNNAAQITAFIPLVQGIRRSGSAALDFCYVAAGRLDGYWEFKLHPWDVAAGRLIVEEAGGTVTWIDGGPVQMLPKLSLVVSNGRLHPHILNVLRPTLAA